MNDQQRVLGHLAFNYRPGDGPVAAKIFEALGCRVEDSGPVNEGGSLYTVLVDPTTASFVDNVFYLSPVRPEQAAFEDKLASLLKLGKADEDQSFKAFRALKAREPEMFFHGALRYASLEALERALQALTELAKREPKLEGRVSIVRFKPRSEASAEVNARIAASPVFRSDDRPSFGDFAIQVFIHTDIFGGEVLAFGQTLELDYLFPQQLGQAAE